MARHGSSGGKWYRLAACWLGRDGLGQRGAVVLSRPLRGGRRAADQPKMATRPWFKGGGAGWLAIGALVITWDLVAPETLSAAFHRARSDPIGSAVVAVVWAGLTGHLFHVIPDRADPFVALFISGRKAVRRGSGRAHPALS